MQIPQNAKQGRRFGQFLMDHYRQEGWDRRTAAERGAVTESYLCHLLAGDVQLPRRDTYKDLKRGWSFNGVEAMLAAGYIDDEDVHQYFERFSAEQQVDEPLPEDLRGLLTDVLDLSPIEREIWVQALRSMLAARQVTVEEMERERKPRHRAGTTSRPQLEAVR